MRPASMPEIKTDTSNVFLLNSNLSIFAGMISFAKIFIIFKLFKFANFFVKISLVRKNSLKSTIFTG